MTPRTLRTRLVGGLSILCVALVSAQAPGIDAGVGLARHWGLTSDPASAVALLPSLSIDRGRWRLDGGISREVAGFRSAQTLVALSGSALGPRIGPFRTTLEGEYVTPTTLDPSANLRTTAQFHWSGIHRGLWLGLGQARVGSAGTLLASSGLWWAGGAGTFSLRFDDALGGAHETTTILSDTLILRRSTPGIKVRSAVARFVGPDGRVELAVASSSIEAPGARGRRGAGANATWWFTPTIAFIGAYGAPMEGSVVGSQRVARFGVLLRHHPALPRPSTLIERPMAEVTHLNDAEWRIRIPAPGAARVEIQGSPTAWEPVALTKGSGGWWELTLTLPPGRHEIIWRRDAGEWHALPGLPSAADPELGEVTVVVAGE